MLFLALKKFLIVKITPQVLTTCKKISPAVFTTFWHKVRETPKTLGEKEQQLYIETQVEVFIPEVNC